MITILGPTATGKTRLAALVADKINGEVISADSRQVYRGMDIGTGKDYDDYLVDGRQVPCHLVDIVDPGYEYNVFEYQRGFFRVYQEIRARGKMPVMCGGTGLYIEAVLKGYQFHEVREDTLLRVELEKKEVNELTDILLSFRSLHNVSDTSDRSRLIRAIEIQTFYRQHPEHIHQGQEMDQVVFGILLDRQTIRRRITERLHARLDAGMVDEVKMLLAKGIGPETLKFYGLEYKFITQYILGEIQYQPMVRLLNTAIHQFAKRQMTWFRRMEKNGIAIHWIDGSLSNEEKMKLITGPLNNIV